MKSAQAYLEEFLGDPDRVARYLRVLREECHTAKDVGYLMRRLLENEKATEEERLHTEQKMRRLDVYRAFTEEAKLDVDCETTGRAIRFEIDSWKAEVAEKKTAAAEDAVEDAVESSKKRCFVVMIIDPDNKEEITELAELSKKYGRIKEYMIIEYLVTKRLIEKEMIQKNIHITDKSHDLCDLLLAIPSSKRRFLPRRRARAGSARLAA